VLVVRGSDLYAQEARTMTHAVTRLAAPVEGVMSRRIAFILEGAPVAEAQALQYDYNAFPVVTPDGRLVGMLTKGEALRPGDSLETAVDHLVDSGLRSLPVIDEASRVVGMVSRNDLMSAIRSELGP